MNLNALRMNRFPPAFSRQQQTRPLDLVAWRGETKGPDNTLRSRPCNVFGGIIQNSEGKYLLVRGRQSGKWSFPKGHIEPNESELECVCREVKEETGITELPNPLRCVPLRAGVYYLFWMPNDPVLEPRDNREIAEAGWFTEEEAAQLRMNIDANTYFINKRAMGQIFGGGRT
jgi:8-oxo-dGTP pyrophosphatase MutT (NUDIX family)